MIKAHQFTRWSFLSPFCQTVFSRYFSLHDASTALRPFIFMVHPDFFGQYPTERIVNENSLKLLNEHLISYKEKRPKPKEILFYIKKGDSLPQELKLVKIPLEAKNLRDTVLVILKTCGLSNGHVAGESKPDYSSNRPIDWHPSYYAATGKKNPHAQPPQTSPTLSLRMWLHENIEKIKTRTEAVRFIKDDIQRLLEKLKCDLSLQSIRCDSVWVLHHFRGCLKSFDRLCDNHPEFMREVFKDRILVFGNVTGVSRTGEIILSSEDVPVYWYTLLNSVAAYNAVLQRLPKMEEKLSSLLNDMSIVRKEQRHGSIMAEEYELMLNKLINTLRRCQGHVNDTFQDCDFSTLQLVVGGEASPLMLSSHGQFFAPASIPGVLVVDFIKEHQDEAYSLSQYMEQVLKEEREKIQETTKDFDLLELNKDESVTPSQMISCCSRLLDQYYTFGGSLAQRRVRVSHYYAIMQDGEICLPWDWVGIDN